MVAAKPVTFWLHFNRLQVAKDDPHVWTVHTSKACIPAKVVHCNVPVITVYKGPSARQPRAYLKGRGVIRKVFGEVFIEES